MKKILITIIAFVILLETPVGAVAVPYDFYSDSNIQFIDPNACAPGGGAAATDTGAAAGSTGSVTYKAMGNIPEAGRDAQATVYGTNGNKGSDGKYVEYLGGIEGGPLDERGKKLKGQTALAEMHGNSALGSLPYGAKVEVKYKDKSIIAEVVDNGPAGASDIDVWRQTADLLDLPYGNTKVKIRGVASSTAVTPVGGDASEADTESSSPAATCCPAATGSSSITATDADVGGDTDIEKVYNKLISLGLSAKAAAGIAGNIVYESGGASPTSEDLDPKSTNGTHWGIVQWDSGRWGNLINFANKQEGKGKSKYNLMTQTAFIMEELNGNYKSVKKEMEAAPTAAEAARIANAKYEITGMQEGRAQAAERIYDKYGEGNTTQQTGTAGLGCTCQDPGVTATGPIANPKNLEDFIKSYADSALAAAKAEGIPYDAMLAQIAHESGLPLSELASKYNNFGGIKFTGEGKATPPMRTYEEGQGYIMARFRAFDSPQEGLQQQAKFFTENSRYKKALKYPRNPRQFIREVAKAGYATDSQYASKVIAMLGQVQDILTKNGKPLSKDVQPDVSNGSDQSDSPLTVGDCTGGTNGVVVDGFSFPVGGLKRNEVGANSPLPCRQLLIGCHHDGTAAFDLGKGKNGILTNESKGLPVYAIEDGTISMYNPSYNFGGKTFPGCPTYQLKGKSGWVYWYGHTAKTSIKAGSKVKAGQKIAEIGASRCTGQGSGNPPHLHIDRGYPKGSPGGSINARDLGISKVINTLWEALPE